MALLVPLAACSDDGGGGGSAETPEEVLAAAKDDPRRDQRSDPVADHRGSSPTSVDGVLEATGVATRAPAFDGDLTVVVNGLDVDVPVVSVDGKVYAKLPFTRSLRRGEPRGLRRPGPGPAHGPGHRPVGLAHRGDRPRGGGPGPRRRDVLSSYTGSLPGDVVDASIPSADEDADFPTTFQIDEDGRLRSVEISGPFYGAKGTVDYTVGVDDYGTKKDITKP